MLYSKGRAYDNIQRTAKGLFFSSRNGVFCKQNKKFITYGIKRVAEDDGSQPGNEMPLLIADCAFWLRRTVMLRESRHNGVIKPGGIKPARQQLTGEAKGGNTSVHS